MVLKPENWDLVQLAIDADGPADFIRSRIGARYDYTGLLRMHLTDFIAAYNFARRLKTLNGLTPYEYICKIWTSEPDRFILNPIHQMPGLNN